MVHTRLRTTLMLATCAYSIQGASGTSKIQTRATRTYGAQPHLVDREDDLEVFAEQARRGHVHEVLDQAPVIGLAKKERMVIYNIRQKKDERATAASNKRMLSISACTSSP